MAFWMFALGGVSALGAGAAAADAQPQPANLFTDPSFELRAMDATDWHLDKAGTTEARYLVNNVDSAAGDRSACVTIGHVAEWGTQFGQPVAAGQKGKTYTFAVLARAVQAPVPIWLQIERRAKPYDPAAASEPVTLTQDKWTEVHVTFTVQKDCPEGWFAYISCAQSDCAYRADMFRLYEGAYVPYQDTPQHREEAASIQVFDTGTKSAVALTPDVLGQRTHWKDIAPGGVCGGDLCVVNSQLAVVVRKCAPGAACYYRLGANWVPGPELTPAAAGGEPAQKTDTLRLVELTPARATVEVSSTTAGGRALTTRYCVRRQQAQVEVQPGVGMASCVVAAPGRYAVVPDIFGGDLLISAAQTPAGRLRCPSERIVAQLLDGGNAMVVCAWRSARQGVQLGVTGIGADKLLTSTEIQCDPAYGLGLWVAVLSAPAIWYQQPIAALDPVKDLKPLWTVPFRALWRADFQRTDGQIDSWKAIIKKSDTEYEGFGVSTKKKSRAVWTATRGTFAYPVCVDGESLCLRNTRFDGLREAKYDPAGHVVVYPFRRISGSPETAGGVFDVLTDALQNTPEAAQLDDLQVKRVPRDQYPATCVVTVEYEKIFADKAEQAKKAELLQRLGSMDQFCIGIRSRIDEYLAWAQKTHAFCAQAKAAKPQLGALVDELDGIVNKFNGVYDHLQLGERTPAAARALIAQVQALIDSREDKKDEKATLLARATRTIGGSQDESIGRFRTITRELRQRAGQRMLTAPDDLAFAFAQEMRERTLEVLQCAFGHEGAFTE